MGVGGWWEGRGDDGGGCGLWRIVVVFLIIRGGFLVGEEIVFQLRSNACEVAGC